uniref:Major facilitator superfamily (MFS) profile domain-containing protein n=1 Tax=Timema douglasi TaxID=61478 RepID=A0A7R8VJI7_TIMDO|nr:unnamed protein product [Timema douglasi]
MQGAVIIDEVTWIDSPRPPNMCEASRACFVGRFRRCSFKRRVTSPLRTWFDVVMSNATNILEMDVVDAPVRENPSRRLPQYLAAIAATLTAFCAGTALGWTSPAIPILQHDPAGNGGLTPEEASWTGALLSLGAVLGAPLTGYLMGRYGRKKAVLALGVPFAVSFIMNLVTGGSPLWLYVARLVAGMGLGGVVIAAPIYVTEIAEDSIRGELGGILQIMFNLGILFVYSVGASESYNVLNLSCLAIPLIFLAAFLWMPETPHFYLATHQKSRAASSLQWLRGARRDVTYELNALQLAVEESARNRGSFKDLVSSQASRKALLISMGLVAFQQLSGISVVLFFTQSIFHDAGSSLSPTLCTILVGLVMVLAAYVGSQLVDRAGRKILLLVSGVFMFLSLFTLGLYFFFLERNYDLKRLGWLPLVSVVVYIVTYVLGFAPLPWTVMAEILPANVKSVGGSIVSAFCWALSFVLANALVVLSSTAEDEDIEFRISVGNTASTGNLETPGIEAGTSVSVGRSSYHWTFRAPRTLLPTFAWRKGGKPFVKNTRTGSRHDLPPVIIGRLVYCESDALDYAATEVDRVNCSHLLDRAFVDQVSMELLVMACRAVIADGRSSLGQPDPAWIDIPHPLDTRETSRAYFGGQLHQCNF